MNKKEKGIGDLFTKLNFLAVRALQEFTDPLHQTFGAGEELTPSRGRRMDCVTEEEDWGDERHEDREVVLEAASQSGVGCYTEYIYSCISNSPGIFESLYLYSWSTLYGPQ